MLTVNFQTKMRVGSYRNRIRRKGTPNGAFLVFLKRWWIVIVALLVSLVWIIPTIKRWVANQKQKNEANALDNEIKQNNAQNSTASPTIQKKKVAEIKKKYPLVSSKKMQEISANAQKVAIALGTNVEDFRPLFGQSWLPMVHNVYTEDEAAAVSIVKKHSGTYPILAELYYNVHTNSRNLTTDLLKYLSKKDLEEIRAAHKKYGNYKHL